MSAKAVSARAMKLSIGLLLMMIENEKSLRPRHSVAKTLDFQFYEQSVVADAVVRHSRQWCNRDQCNGIAFDRFDI